MSWFVFGTILVALVVGLVLAYSRDMRRALAQAGAEQQRVETPRGPIAYTSHGEGAAVLVVHGWGGGGAGGYNMFEFLSHEGFRILSVSRPGYLGTPLQVGETMESQADALAALLDALGIPSVAVVTGSGGAPVSVLFALRHPDRCWGLILASALTRPDPILGKSAVQKTLEKAFHSGFLVWLITKFFWRSLVEAGMGRLNERIRGDAKKMDALQRLTQGLILSSRCREGLINDMRQWAQMPIYPLPQVRVPTLIFHSRNDNSVPYTIAEFTATIPQSKLLTFEDGGHTCYLVHAEVTEPATIEFLKAHRPSLPEQSG